MDVSRGCWFLVKRPEKHLASDGLTGGSQICALDEINQTAGLLYSDNMVRIHSIMVAYIICLLMGCWTMGGIFTLKLILVFFL